MTPRSSRPGGESTPLPGTANLRLTATQYCNGKLRGPSVRRYSAPANRVVLSYRLPGSFLGSRPGSLLPRAEGRFVSAGTSLGRGSATSRRICAPASLGIGRNSMPPMRNVVKYINIVTRRLTTSSTGMLMEPMPPSPPSSQSARTQAASDSVQAHR